MLNLFFWVSYVALWLIVLTLFIAVFLLYRHHGQMLLGSREGRVAQGPELYEPVPNVYARDVDGALVRFSQPGARALFTFVGSADCKPCLQALPHLATFATHYAHEVETVLVCGGSREDVGRFTAELPPSIRVVPDPQRKLASRMRVSSTPFAFIANPQRIICGKGMPATLEVFERFIDELRQYEEQAQAEILPEAVTQL